MDRWMDGSKVGVREGWMDRALDESMYRLTDGLTYR